MDNKSIVNECYQKGYSLIPLKNNSKVPAIRWKRYQYRQASKEEIFNWSMNFREPNVALITGLKLVVIDLDDIEKLKELLRILPEIDRTTKVKTRRGFHFYFSSNEHKIRSTKNLFGLGIELKASGNYVVAPPSKIDNFTYNFEIPLSKIKPLPGKIINGSLLPGTGIKEGGQAPDVEYKKRKVLSLPRYAGKNISCIEQILNRELKIGERDSSLFILYNLLLQNKNTKEYSKKLVVNKNNSLVKPLTDKDMKKVFRKAYGLNGLKCSKVREFLPFIECDKCRFKFKGGSLRMGNVLVKNLRNLEKLDPSEQRVLLFLGTVFDGEQPSNYAIAKKMGMNKDIVKRVMEGLRKKGILQE